jgi:hypothetical protein
MAQTLYVITIHALSIEHWLNLHSWVVSHNLQLQEESDVENIVKQYYQNGHIHFPRIYFGMHHAEMAMNLLDTSSNMASSITVDNFGMTASQMKRSKNKAIVASLKEAYSRAIVDVYMISNLKGRNAFNMMEVHRTWTLWNQIHMYNIRSDYLSLHFEKLFPVMDTFLKAVANEKRLFARVCWAKVRRALTNRFFVSFRMPSSTSLDALLPAFATHAFARDLCASTKGRIACKKLPPMQPRIGCVMCPPLFVSASR